MGCWCKEAGGNAGREAILCVLRHGAGHPMRESPLQNGRSHFVARLGVTCASTTLPTGLCMDQPNLLANQKWLHSAVEGCSPEGRAVAGSFGPGQRCHGKGKSQDMAREGQQDQAR